MVRKNLLASNNKVLSVYHNEKGCDCCKQGSLIMRFPPSETDKD